MKNTYLKKLFLLDGFGALLSAFLLGIVLVKLETYFGIPKQSLYFLAALPVLFALYDFYCYFKIEENLGKFLKGIAIVNILYCCLSIAFAFHHYQSITYLGWAYIIGEIIIVVAIAIVELRAVKLS
jgi:hypothetical protein